MTTIQTIGLRILFLIAGYAFGLFQTGVIYGKITKTDLRTKGSGNTGATNALRVMGVKSALIILFFDALKAFIPTFAARMIFKGSEMAYIYALYAAFGAVLGNDYPFFLKFKGGKGVGATCGYILALDWRMWIVGMTLFFLIALVSRYVSLASCCAAVFLIAANILFAVFGWFMNISGPFSMPVLIEYIILIVMLEGLMIWRHKENIRRLIHGTENRFGKKK